MNNGYVLDIVNKEYFLYYNNKLLASGKDLDYVMSFYKEEPKVVNNEMVTILV